MDAFELLNKRRHIHKFSVTPPPKEIIEKILWKAWKVTPSKNNFIPYNINVLGPDAVEEKEQVLNLSKLNKKRTNERENPNNIANYEEDGFNANFEFLNTVPYLLVCTQRICEPNEYIRSSIVNDNNVYEQMHERLLNDIMKTTAAEVGMFKANLSAFALEEGIDISCIACTPHRAQDWIDAGLDFVQYPVMLLIGLGYCEVARQDSMSQDSKDCDKKPDPETIIRWI